MPSISATSGSNYLSPLQQLQDQLQTDVNSGTVSSSDQGALSSALNDINSSLQSGVADSSSSGSSSSPSDLKSKIDTLIANEVSSGKLTSDQATELQGVFKQAFAAGSGGSDAAGGASTAVTRFIRPGMQRARLRASARSASRAQTSGAMGGIGILSGSSPSSPSAGVRAGAMMPYQSEMSIGA